MYQYKKSHGEYKPFLSDKEVDQILLDDSSVSSLEIESDSVQSEIDYAQEEFVIVNEQEHDAKQETDVTADDKDVQWVWHEVNVLHNNVKIPFTGQSGAQKDFVSVLDTFLLFFDEEVIAFIVTETNKYAEQYIQKCTPKPRSRVRKWEPVTGEEIYVALRLTMLMGIVQKPIIKSYFPKDPFLETPIFYKTMTQDRFKLITKFLHFTNNSTRDTYTEPPKLFKIQPILELLNNKFQSAYLPAENIAIDESLTLWKDRLGLKQYIPLKSAKFGIKTFELCESATGYLWKFIVHSGAGAEAGLQSNIQVPDNLKSSKIVIELCELLMNNGYCVWMDNCYNSPSLCLLLSNMGINVAGTLRLNRRNVPACVKQKETEKRGNCNSRI
jgi:hypothetical protein